MRRYLRLYGYFLRFSFSRAMEFRVDFCFRIGMDLVWNAMYLAFFSVIFLHTGRLGGWTYDQVLVFAGTLFVSDALHMTVFSNNMWWFPIHVNRGDLDYHLVRPVSALFFVSLREFAANSFVNLLVATSILTWALARYPAPLSAASVALFVGLVLLGAFLGYVVQMIFFSTVFWLHSAEGVKNTYFSFGGISGRPHGIFHGWMRRVFTTVLPFCLFSSFPVESLFGGEPAAIAGHMLLVAGLAFLALLLVWRSGLRAYASASS